MNLGPNSSVLKEFLSHIDANGRVIVLADLAELGHDYKAGDILKVYRELKAVCESWDLEDIDDFKASLIEFVDHQYKTIRSKLGSNAMQIIRAINENENEEDNEQQIKNKEKFEKEAEKRKKGEQTPIAKARRSRGETQDDMADVVDVHKSTISRWKTGKRKPSFDNLKKLSDRYGKGLITQLLST